MTYDLIYSRNALSLNQHNLRSPLQNSKQFMRQIYLSHFPNNRINCLKVSPGAVIEQHQINQARSKEPAETNCPNGVEQRKSNGN